MTERMKYDFRIHGVTKVEGAVVFEATEVALSILACAGMMGQFGMQGLHQLGCVGGGGEFELVCYRGLL